MRINRMPPQITRLVLLTIAIVVTYMVAKYFLTPPSFGEYGFYRGDALVEMASHPISYAGKQACEVCHADEYDQLSKFQHQSLSCEGCHGPGEAHVENPDENRLAVLTYGLCLRCHAANPSRPAWHKQIDPKDHYTGETCTSCHVPHAPWEVPEEPEEP